MKTHADEPKIPQADRPNRDGLKGVASASNVALAPPGPRVQWTHSHMTEDRTFCIYIPQSRDAIVEHPGLSGVPANKITDVNGVIDLTTAQ